MGSHESTNDIDNTGLIDLRDGAVAPVGSLATSEELEISEGSNPVSDIIAEKELQVALARQHDQSALAPSGVNQLETALANRKVATRYSAEVESMKARGYAAVPPRFGEILEDDSRTMPFCWCVKKYPEETYANMTEMAGLQQLNEFLGDFIAGIEEKTSHLRRGQELRLGHLKPDKIASLYEQARSIKDRLTFIGWPEYQQAVKGIGAYWKDMLNENPDLQICVPSPVAELNRYQKFGNRKSDESLLEDVLLTFTDEELREYGKRIVRRLDDISYSPKNTKIILLDDWVISGGQIRDTYRHIIKKHPLGAVVADAGNVEAHMLVAQEQRIKQGLALNPYKPQRGTLPVIAYFKAHGVHIVTDHNSGSHISGQHSAVNYDFYDPIMEMEKISSQIGIERPRIALARIEPWYRNSDIKPAITFQNGYAERVYKPEGTQSERTGE